MLLRIIIFSVFLFYSTLSFAASTGNTGELTKGKDTKAQYNDDNIYVYKWIGDVRWVFVYGQDGTIIDSYPDPDY